MDPIKYVPEHLVQAQLDNVARLHSAGVILFLATPRLGGDPPVEAELEILNRVVPPLLPFSSPLWIRSPRGSVARLDLHPFLELVPHYLLSFLITLPKGGQTGDGLPVRVGRLRCYVMNVFAHPDLDGALDRQRRARLPDVGDGGRG